MSQSCWMSRAELIQDSIDPFFLTQMPQYLHNTYPFRKGDDKLFNYWWLAHLMDCRVDAFLRSGDPHRLQQAKQVHDNIIERNHGSLFNDYFDDMLWFALATLRLYEVTKDHQYLEEVFELWNFVISNGWNSIMGPSLSWRKQQPYYKNMPANGPLVILGARLFRITHRESYLSFSKMAFQWVTNNLIRPDGFVDDGKNRQGDFAVDVEWEFTYNQGLYIGAAVELADCDGGHRGLITAAERTVSATLSRMINGEVFKVDGDGGDEGLFKGIFYRYAGLFLEREANSGQVCCKLTRFIRRSTDVLWSNCMRDHNGYVLAGNDWGSEPHVPQFYSTQLSAIMAVEQRARIEA